MDQGWMSQAAGSLAYLDVVSGSARDGGPGGNGRSWSTGQGPYTDATLQMGTGKVVPILELLSAPREQLGVSCCSS